MQSLQPEDPQLIGKYRLLARLGSGGMGRVYLGQSPGGRLVAVKLIRSELAESAQFRQRFAREVAAARTVGAMFTAPVVDADPDAPEPWLVTAYIDGLSLADAVASHGPLPVTSVLYLAAGLAEGLSAIHAAGLVHRDLKPSNVLLAGDGPRIIDFGISRAVDATGLTMSGLVVGSPGFMSPEQAEGREVGPASDVFSLGALLAFSATGAGPFGEGSTPALIYRVVHGEPATERLPGPVRPLIEQCLSKEPQQRPAPDQILAELGTVEPRAGWLPWPDTRRSRGDLPPEIAGPPAQGAGGLAAGQVRAPTELAGPAGLGGNPADQVTRDPAVPGQPPGGTWPAQPDGTGQPPRPGHRRRLLLAGTALAAILAAGGAAAAVVIAHDATDRRPVAAKGSRGLTPRTPAASAASSPAAAPSAAATLPPSAAAASPSGAAAAPQAVVEDYIAAINQHDWPVVWRLGGDNLGPTYSQMVNGYRLTSKDVITSLVTNGSDVSATILAYETTGPVQTYNLQYVVSDGVIVSGSQTLTGTSP